MLLWATEAITLAALLIAAWLHDRSQVLTGFWGAGFAGHGLGMTLVGLRGIIPDGISIVVGNDLVLIGIGMWCAGVMHYDRRRISPWVFLPAAVLPCILLLPDVYPHFWMRTTICQLCAASAYAILCGLHLYAPKPSPLSRKVFAAVVFLQVLIMVNMATDSFIARPAGFSEMPEVTIYSIISICCLVAGIILGTRMLMIRSEERLRELALTDPLTMVLNRRGLLDRYPETISRLSAARPMLALALFDLDDFKRINDTYGHQTGDRVLIGFCEIARACVGEKGYFGRMGGEEFACILPVSNLAEAVGVVEATRLMLHDREMTSEDGRLFRATVSAGICLAGSSQAQLYAMLSNADKALYAAKNAGRNRTAVGDGEDAFIIPGDREPRHVALHNNVDQALVAMRVAREH